MGFEPTYTALQAAASPLGHSTTRLLPASCASSRGIVPPSGRRDSNPRPSPWQGDALPTEPRPRDVVSDVAPETLTERSRDRPTRSTASRVTSVRWPGDRP